MQADSNAVSKEFLSICECVPLRTQNCNRTIVDDFDGGNYGVGLEKYLKECAWNEDELDKTRVYLVKEKKTKRVFAYFSLRCGLLFLPYAEDVNAEDEEFMGMLADALETNDEEALSAYKASGYYPDDRFAKLLEEVQSRLDFKRSGNVSRKDFNVRETSPAVELHNICKNHLYPRTDGIKAPFGVLVFWICIAPIVMEIVKTVGCRYIYLFAAEQEKTLCNEEEHKLVEYYKNNLKFHDFDEAYVIRPSYDRDCHEMVQSVDELRRNMQAIWEEFSDVLTEV